MFQELTHFEDLYARLSDIGCVLQFAPLRYSGAGHHPGEIHRQAALAGLQILKQRTDAYFEHLLKRPEYADRQRCEFFQTSIDPARLGSGQRIELDAFLGPYCDLAQRRLLMRGEHREGRTAYYWYGDETDQNKRQSAPDLEFAEAGLARAYLAPPYHLRGSQTQKNALFFEIVDQLLGGLAEPVEIFAWSPDSSNFFDAGKEWWGCYFWTLHPPDSERYIVIAASTTD